MAITLVAIRDVDQVDGRAGIFPLTSIKWEHLSPRPGVRDLKCAI